MDISGYAANADQAGKSPLSAAKRAAYAGIAVPIAVINVPVIIYIAPYYATELGLGLGTVGTLFLAVRLIDALFDIVIGKTSDRTPWRFGRRRSWIAIGTPILMIATWFLCFPPPHPSATRLGVSIVIFYVAWTLIQIPHLSWGQDLGVDSVDRGRMSAWRESGTILGTLLAMTLPIIIPAGNETAVAHSVHLLGVVAIAGLFLTATVAIAAVGDTPPEEGKTHSRLMDLLTDRILGPAILANLLMQIAIGCYNAVIFLLVEKELMLTGWFMKLVFMQYVIAVATVPIFVFISRRIGMMRSAIVGAVLFICGLLVMAFAQDSVAIACLAFFLVGTSVSAINISTPTAIADLARRRQAMDGLDRMGEHLALYNLTLKLGLAIGAGAGMLLLGVAQNQMTGVAPFLFTPARVVGCYLSAIIFALSIPVFSYCQRILRRDDIMN
jgi:GPH family glycoside/pentoside/hexuronide:cation symporter